MTAPSPASFMTAQSSYNSPAFLGESVLGTHTDSRLHNKASPFSDFASPASFMTVTSPGSLMFAQSSYDSPAFLSGSVLWHETIIEADETVIPQGPLVRLGLDYQDELRQRQLFQPFDKELNWSGRGQHVIFGIQEHVPLDFIAHLGASATARVEKVRCRRVALARKTMRCNGSWNRSKVLQEVTHLQNLRHFHIVQLVGTYLKGRDFSLLMYPAADYHLGTFLEDTEGLAELGSDSYFRRISFLRYSLHCLASAVRCIHQNSTKHMDIKPQDILVKRSHEEASYWRIYIADFGLSRSFADLDHSQTDGPTARTPKYCAPEVYEYESRGRSSDIFSLGCVYTEIFTVMEGRSLTDFTEFRRNVDDDASFYRNLPKVNAWIKDALASNKFLVSTDQDVLYSLVLRMLDRNLSERPDVEEIWRCTTSFGGIGGIETPCCRREPEPYVAYDESGEGAGGLHVQ